MGALSYELSALGVTRLVIESRGPADDKRDMDHLQGLRASHTIDSRLRLEHVPGPLEPALWVPDIVCGTFAQAELGHGQWLHPLKAKVVQHQAWG